MTKVLLTIVTDTKNRYVDHFVDNSKSTTNLSDTNLYPYSLIVLQDDIDTYIFLRKRLDEVKGSTEVIEEELAELESKALVATVG